MSIMSHTFAVVALFAAVSVAETNDVLDAAPVDGTVDLTYCTKTSDCTWNGDSAATCAAGQCVCAANTGDYCQIGASDVAETTRISIVITLPNAVCESVVVARFIARINENLRAIGITGFAITTACGSVTTVLDFESNTKTMGTQVNSIVGAVQGVATDMSDFSGVTASDKLIVNVQVASTVSRANQATCADNAVNTAVAYDGRCLILECATGYTLTTYVVGDKTLFSCAAPATPVPVRETDDDLTDGAIAAIAVSSILFALVILGLVIFAFTRSSNAVPEAAESDKNAPYGLKEQEV